MTPVSPEEFTVLAKYIHAISGVALNSSKAYLIETRLKPMMDRYACASYMDLHTKIMADHSGEMEKEMVNAITTNETLFFRDRVPFDVLKHKILPDIIDARTKTNPGRPIPLRIWSTACSTGQEIYSIAIALRESLGSMNKYQITILGTDISDDAITKASYGKYNKFEIERGLPPHTLNKYFTPAGDGWRIHDDIRAMTVFRKFNLMKPFVGLGCFDVIFCRNVAIYFTPADKKKVFEKIATALAPDGALIIGSTETLNNVTDLFEPKRSMRTVFYQHASGNMSAATPQAVNPDVAPTPWPNPQANTLTPPRNILPVPPDTVETVHHRPPDAPPTENRETAPRTPLNRDLPAQPYRAGDKSALKRLLMQKKRPKN